MACLSSFYGNNCCVALSVRCYSCNLQSRGYDWVSFVSGFICSGRTAPFHVNQILHVRDFFFCNLLSNNLRSLVALFRSRLLDRCEFVMRVDNLCFVTHDLMHSTVFAFVVHCLCVPSDLLRAGFGFEPLVVI